ncbi:MAG: caspase family protein [Spirochaetaceae bacterium]
MITNKKFSLIPALFYCILLISCVSNANNITDSSNSQLNMVFQGGHVLAVTDVAVSPDGKFYATCGYDNMVMIWRSTDNVLVKQIGFKSHLNSISYSPDGTKLAVGGSGVNLIDILTGNILWNNNESELEPFEICWSKDGLTILTAQGKNPRDIIRKGKVVKYSAKSGNIIISTDYSENVYSIQYNDDFSLYGIGLSDGSIKVYKPLGGLYKTINSSSEIRSLQFLDTGTIITGHLDGELRTWNLETGDLLNNIKLNRGPINSLAYNKNSGLLLCGIEARKEHQFSNEAKGIVILYEPKTRKIISEYDKQLYLVNSIKWLKDDTSFISVSGEYQDGEVYSFNIKNSSYSKNPVLLLPSSVNFNAKNNVLVTTGKKWDDLNIGSISFLDLLNFNLTFGSIGKYGSIDNANIHPSGDWLVANHKTGDITVWDSNSQSIIKTLPRLKYNQFFSAFNHDGSLLALASSLDGVSISHIRIMDTINQKILWSKDISDGIFHGIAFNKKGDKIYCAGGSEDDQKGKIHIFETLSGKLIDVVDIGSRIRDIDISPDDTIILGIDTEDVNYGGLFLKPKNMKISKTLTNYDTINRVSINNDGTLFAAGEYSGTVSIWDLEKKKIIYQLPGFSNIESLSWHKTKNIVTIGYWNGSIKLWNIDNDKSATLIIRDQDWIIYTPEGYFAASEDGGKLTVMVDGLTAYGIDQFALTNNRPDIVLRDLNLGNDEVINYYYNLYLKRLKKSGFSELNISQTKYVPYAQILTYKQHNKFIDLTFKLSDEHSNLIKYNIYINDVPIYGAYGKKIFGNNITITEAIELSSGNNKIEVTCINNKGVESYRPVINITYKELVKANLYFIGFGVSNYQDDILDLKYASKDVVDLGSVLKSNLKTQFKNIYIHTFIDEEVTAENMISTKSLLENAKVDDTFILLVAGHGVHDNDEESTYYYLTYNTEINDLKNTAINFEEIENLMQGIAPRNKLFLMDTCESGETDEETEARYYTLAGSRGIQPRTARGLKVISKTEDELKPRKYLQNSNRFIYNDLFRRSGAIVFSSSNGGEFSYESDKIQNGFFSEGILKCLSDPLSDKNKNGFISIKELQDYVVNYVSKETKGLQNPTIDRDNIYQKFNFQVSK